MEKYKTDSNLLLQIGLIYVSRWTRTVKDIMQKLCFTYPSPITTVIISRLEAKNHFSCEGWNEGLSFTRNYSVFKHFRSESEGLKDIFE
jgi:hypothetical protein